MKKIIFIFSFVSIIACSPTFKNKYEWLVGSWGYKTENTYSVENWSWQKDNETYMSEGFFIANNQDTIYKQKIKFYKTEENLFLTVKTSGNTFSKEAFFELENSTNDSLIFKNKFKTFPEYIVYRKVDDTTIETSAIGVKNNKQIVESRILNKIKE